MEREKFEDKLKNAFEGAEVSPTENVWTNIELDLARAEAGMMKQRLVFFKMLAAASVIFAFIVGGLSLYSISEKGPFPAGVEGLSAIRSETGQNNSVGPSARDLAVTDALASVPRPAETKKSIVDHSGTSLHIVGFQSSLSRRVDEASDQMIPAGVDPISEETMASLRPARAITLHFKDDANDVDPVAMMLAKLDLREHQLRKEEKRKDSNTAAEENLWTSLGFAAGGFNAITSGTPPVSSGVATFSNDNIAEKEARASGIAYAMGLNMGTRLADRWVLQGGVNYLTQSSDYTAQTAVGSPDFQSFRPASINELEKLNHADGPAEARVVTTAPYNVNNNVRYLSLPVQAGYLIIDKKVGLQVNAGVSTDLFLHNSKTAQGENIDQISQGRGEDSPYRSLNFSGLVGTELSYRFGTRYRVALNPGLRYPINSIYKSDIGVQSSPLTFDLGLRFRYIFH